MAKLIEIPVFSDSRGSLCVIQDSCPFPIKRVFYICDVEKSRVRAEHGHLKNRMLLTAAKGSCSVFFKNTSASGDVVLDAKNKAILLEPEDWHRLYNITSDCVLIVMCSELYNNEDYFFEEPL